MCPCPSLTATEWPSISTICSPSKIAHPPQNLEFCLTLAVKLILSRLGTLCVFDSSNEDLWSRINLLNFNYIVE